MQGLSSWDTEPGQWYRYNGKERDTLSGWTDFGARWGILEIGRWHGVDPLADWAPDWTPYRYGFDNPISYTDPFGLFETRKEARQYRREKTDLNWWNSSIRKNKEGSFDIRQDLILSEGSAFLGSAEAFITDMGGDLGVVKGISITPRDVIGAEETIFATKYTRRDDSVYEFDRPVMGLPGGGAVVKGGVTLMGYASKTKLATQIAAKTGTTGFRYMTEGELKAIQQSGMLRGGNPGKTYFTKDLYKSGAHAQQRLSLPTTPTLRVEFEILNNPTMRLSGSKVLPDFGMPGKGAEFMTTDPVKVRLINWQPLR